MRDGSSCAQVMAIAAPLDSPIIANDGARTASAIPSTSRAWFAPVVPVRVGHLAAATAAQVDRRPLQHVQPAGRSARRSNRHSSANGRLRTPRRRIRGTPPPHPKPSGCERPPQSSSATACCVMWAPPLRVGPIQGSTRGNRTEHSSPAADVCRGGTARAASAWLLVWREQLAQVVIWHGLCSETRQIGAECARPCCYVVSSNS